MTISDDRIDRFTFMPGDLAPVKDSASLHAVHEETGVFPYSQEKQQWITDESVKRYSAHIPFDTEELADEYDRLKVQGKI